MVYMMIASGLIRLCIFSEHVANSKPATMLSPTRIYTHTHTHQRGLVHVLPGQARVELKPLLTPGQCPLIDNRTARTSALHVGGRGIGKNLWRVRQCRGPCDDSLLGASQIRTA